MEIADLRAEIGSEDAKAAFDLLVEGFAALDLKAYAHEKGYISTLRVERGEDWCFAVNPAEDWILSYVRKPELRRGRLTEDALLNAFPDARVSKLGEVLLRIADAATASRWLDMVRAAG